MFSFSTNLHDPNDLNCSLRNHSFETEMMRFIEQTNTTPQLFHGRNFRYRNDWIQTLTKLQNTHFSSCHHQESKGTNSSKNIFEEQLIQNIKSRQRERGYPENLVQKTLSEMQLKNRKLELLQKPQGSKRILPFVTQYHPAVTNLKQILMKLNLIDRQPLLKEIYKNRPSCYKRGRSIRYTRESEITKQKG